MSERAQLPHEVAPLHGVVDVLSVEEGGERIYQDQRERFGRGELRQRGVNVFWLLAPIEDDDAIDKLGEVDVEEKGRDLEPFSIPDGLCGGR